VAGARGGSQPSAGHALVSDGNRAATFFIVMPEMAVIRLLAAAVARLFIIAVPVLICSEVAPPIRR